MFKIPGNYTRIPNEYIQLGYAKKLPVYCEAIYHCLLYHLNLKTTLCFPSEKTIANELGISRNTVRKHIMFLEEYNIIIRNKKPTKSGNYVFYYTFNSPNKWRKIESICSPHEHPNDSDVHIVTNECSYQHNSDVHEVNTNNKKLTIRNNNDLENDFCSSFNEELEIFDDKSEDIRNKNEPLVTKKKMPEFYKQLPNNHPAVKKWEEENSF